MNPIAQIKRLTVLHLLAVFLIIVAAWFAWHAPVEKPANRTTGPALSGAEGFAAGSAFQPDASNVSPSMQDQLAALQKQVLDAPEDTTHLYRLALMLQDAHRPEEAAMNYRRYLSLHPGNYRAWLDMTQCLGQAKQWRGALEALNEMLGRYPDDPSALYNLGAVHANLGNTREARSYWQKTIEMSKNTEVTQLAEDAMQRLPSD